ncbi:beta-glucosidase [Blastomonas natatoria]|uniref:Beta-glucosidase n=1 Tax=Blastomonas natatoria TaxID=34015 RepID=A0A2V3USR4_9SPHN|nr:glycoside hydrolase family 3 C-terminal domain-containing protein [Blastomonas natatoria]PXW69807.1 beta-glucosidase [Blastomonas natatoria]
MNVSDHHRKADRCAQLLAEMSLDEKIGLLAGKDFWSLSSVERLGIPSLRMSDGPTGLRSVNSDPATVFPVGTALAATFDSDLVTQVSAAIGREAIAHGVDVLLAPGINIQRTPLGGRNFEYYSEDPVLAGAIGTAYVNGVQSEGVGTSVKHFAANNQEHRRMDGSSDVSERVLREIYLAAFEQVVSEAAPWTIMSAYNRINGVFCSQNGLLLDGILKGEWGYEGVVVSDWGAAKDTVGCAKGGLDLEMPGPARVFGPALQQAVEAGQIMETTIDDHALRVLRLIERCGLLDGNPKASRGQSHGGAHRELARRAAADSMVLLKNEDAVLPISVTGRLAVIGALADHPAIQGGGSSQVTPERIISPLDALREQISSISEIVFERGVDAEPGTPTINPRLLETAQGDQGLTARYYPNPDFDGAPVLERTEWWLSKLGFGDAAQSATDLAFSVEWKGILRPRFTGRHTFELLHSNPDVWLEIDGAMLVGETTPRQTELLFMILPLNRRHAAIMLEAGRDYQICIRYAQPGAGSIRAFNIFDVKLREPAPDRERAITAVRNSEVVLVFAGPGTTAETEGVDRASMRLPEAQNALIEDIAAINPNTVVCINCGGPVEMPWANKVKGIVQCWLPGQEGGHAIADVLTGAVNPSGKLPVTFPRRYEDNPSFLHYPGGARVHYGEGLFVGYRHYDAAGVEPEFPFGHGLSYTRFALSDVDAPQRAEAFSDITVACTLANTGDLPGAEVVQIYLEHLDPAETMPLRQLKAFAKCKLAPREHARMSLTVPGRAFAWFDVDAGGWTVTPGRYRLHIGTSSRNLPLVRDIEITA